MAPNKRRPDTAMSGPLENRPAATLICSRDTSRKTEKQALAVATIDIGRSAQLRVSLVEWRGSRKVELRIATSQIPGLYIPTRDGFEIDVALLPALIKALQKANAAASSRKGGSE